jgi:hypothetical protein
MHFLSTMLLSLSFLYILLKDKLKCQIILCRLEVSDCQIIAPGRVGSAPWTIVGYFWRWDWLRGYVVNIRRSCGSGQGCEKSRGCDWGVVG